MLLPSVSLGWRGLLPPSPWGFHAEKHHEVAFDAEVVLGAVGKFVAQQTGGAVFAIELHHFIESNDVCVFRRVFPKRSAEEGVEFVVKGEDGRGELYALVTNTPSSGTGGIVYEIVPEPASVVNIGVAAIALLGLRRRRASESE